MTTTIRKMNAQFLKMWIAVFAAATLMDAALAGEPKIAYQNDFSIRTSEVAPDGWHEKSYVYPASLCTRFNYSPSTTRATRYNDLSQTQDGWFKSFGTATAMGQNANQTMYAEVTTNKLEQYWTENDADNPFVELYSYGGYNVTNEMMVVHSLGNAFTNGVLRISVDMHMPEVWHGQSFFAVRPMFAKAMESETPQPDLYPMEFGFYNYKGEGENSYKWGNDLRPMVNGGKSGEVVPTKSRTTLMTWAPASNRWYRCMVLINLDSGIWRFDKLYNMGANQPLSFSDVPVSDYDTGGYLGKNVGKEGNFYHMVSGETGPIAGIAFHAYHINRTYYSSLTHHENAPRADNVKVEWKAPGAAEFVSCYENDFAECRVRRVSPEATSSGTYAMGVEPSASTFSGYPKSDNPSIVSSGYFFRTVPDGSATLPSYLGDPGVDGWRRLNAQNGVAYGSVHSWGGDGGAVLRVISTKEASQTALFVNRFSSGLTTGYVRLSADVRLPDAWRLTSSRSIAVRLGSAALYTAADSSAASTATLVYAGVGNATGSEFNPAWKAGDTWTPSSSAALSANNWYRIVVMADLSNRTYGYSLYPMGANTVAANAAPAGAAVCEQSGLAFSGAGTDIATIGLETTSVGYCVDKATLFDNLKVERSDDASTWTTVYENDFATRTAYEVAGAEHTLAPKCLGVPDIDMDGWVRRGAGFGDVKVSGSANPAVAFSTGSDSACAVHAIGKSVKDFTISVDVRPPVYWSLTNGFAHIILGGDEFYQGEIGTKTVGENSLRNFEEAAALRFGIGHNTGSSAMLGVFRETDVCAVAGDGTAVWSGTNFDRSLSRWYRFKAKVDSLHNTWTLSVFDMGTEHPTLEATGSLIGSRGGLPLGELPPDGITAIGLKVNGVPVGIRYYEDSDGGVLFDNIRIREASGCVISFR